MSTTTTAPKTVAKNGTKAEATPVHVAGDENKAVQALAAAGWPGRTAQEALNAARKVVSATGRLAANAADDELANAAAKAAGGTGIASHDRARVAATYAELGDIVAAAEKAAPTREGAQRALVWYVATLNAAEAEAK